MATFYKESNSEPTEDLYDKSLIYLALMEEYAQTYSCVTDFAFAEKAFYGKVDRNFVSIEPNQIFRLTRIPNTFSTNNGVEVASFVADAFAGLSRHFQRSIQIGAIRRNDPYLSNLVAFEGYTKPSIAYEEYFNTVIASMSRVKQIKNVNFRNFQQFIDFFIDFSKSVAGRYPITKTGFIRSRHNSLLNCGLALEVTDIAYENDNEKVESFINSPNFEYYLNACNSYGFMVDASAPWRIVADLDSVAMQEHASRYGYINTDSIISSGYKKTHNSSFRQLPEQMLNIYNQISSYYTDFEKCDGNLRSLLIEPKQTSLEEINNSYNESYFINLYCVLRFIEEENKYSSAKQKQIITDTINLSRINNSRTALRYFEKFISQPFDYRGSLSYLNKARRLREDT
jgi:hypothetical protein